MPGAHSIQWFGSSLLALALAFSACTDHDDDPGDSDTDGMDQCPECKPGQEPYLCIINGLEDIECYDDLAAAQASCGGVPGNGVVGNGPAPCANQTVDPSVSWDPGKYIGYDEQTRTYEVDRTFLQGVLDEPNQLLYDQARVEWRGDHFEFVDIAKGDLVDLLGFEDGDALSEINGYSLSTMVEIADAYEALYEESSFSVAIVRDDATLLLTYVLVDDA